jgi:ribosome-associated toxin RatA of RatAB toxin-antitoxin module
MEVRRSLLVLDSAERMFDLIEAAEHYPEFLPWCAAATIVERTDDIVVADITVAVHGVRFEFRTRNPKRRPEWMSIELERGPFRHFHGEWQLTPLDATGCKIRFDMRYDFEHSVLGRLAAPVFDRIASTLVDAFVVRAETTRGASTVPTPVPATDTAVVPPISPSSDPGAPEHG